MMRRFGAWGWRLFAGGLVAAVVSGTVQAEDFCQALQGFTAEPPQDMSVTFEGAAPAQCSGARSLGGGAQRYCHWAFEYRAEAARAAYEAVLAQVPPCLGVAGSGDGEPLVNHPDSYDLQGFDTAKGKLFVSLKDKGALGQTLLFMRMEFPASPE